MPVYENFLANASIFNIKSYREGFMGIPDVADDDGASVSGGSVSGDTGTTGTTGNTGNTGNTGATGATGNNNNNNNNILGIFGNPNNILAVLFSGSSGASGSAGLFNSLGLPGLNNIISPSGIPGVPGTETNSTISSQEMALANQIFVYVIHILVSIILTYLWGIFGANALFLVTLSEDEKDYILPTKPYSLPYCDERDTSKCLFGYGFPYDLSARMCNSDQQILHVIEKEEKNINILTAFKDGSSGDGMSDALYNYIFNSVYGGVGRGGRGFTKMILELCNPSDSTTPKNKETWSTEMKESPFRRCLIFLIFPILFAYILIPIMGLVAGVMGAIFGVLNNHPFWGLFFTLILGIFIFIGNGIWTALQTVYFFGYYPCAEVEPKKKARYNDIFHTCKPYLMNIFYCFIVYFAFLDLGSGIGGGIMFIAIIAAFTGFV